MTEAKGPKHSVSISAVILDDQGRALAIRRHDNGNWEPPGGVLELSESITAGLIREVEEETGLLVEPEKLTGVYKNLARGIVALVFRCRVVGGALTPSPETPELAWLSPAEVSDRMSEAYAIRVEDALSVGSPAVRAHDGHRLVAAETSAHRPNRAPVFVAPSPSNFTQRRPAPASGGNRACAISRRSERRAR